MSATVVAVADEILRQAKKKGLKLTPLQLMKLTYIAFGWYAAIKGERLFNERIEAWKYGPVIPDLYKATKRYGRDAIPLDLIIDDGGELDKETCEFLADVVAKYGHLSGFALSSLTHQQNTPWADSFREDVFNIEIPYDRIKAHYTELLDARNRSPAAAKR